MGVFWEGAIVWHIVKPRLSRWWDLWGGAASSACPTLGMMLPVLLTSPCKGRASRVAPLLCPVLIPLRPSLSAPHPGSEALLGSRRDVAPWAGKECLHSWKSPVSYFGIALPAGSNVSSLPAFPNVGVACMPTSLFSLPPLCCNC